MAGKRFQVWVAEDPGRSDENTFMRFNARFDSYEAALAECHWYTKHRYVAEVFDNQSGRVLVKKLPAY